ncbi:114aa long hypothetical protein [Pyrococcus horikoshii OT3]|uniref:Uncharacterized protein n=1 Tax=Pyrococcus horikoshii (strain ATCC 700860 / DSM 12428 / JCM 9974 / NBRC 100139 / OT-3) TaxID=70601 RepID=O58664_PYRHO|nr:114aa long hypothetical protein [Pyrococcus horikoshii OT3]
MIIIAPVFSIPSVMSLKISFSLFPPPLRYSRRSSKPIELRNKPNCHAKYLKSSRPVTLYQYAFGKAFAARLVFPIPAIPYITTTPFAFLIILSSLFLPTKTSTLGEDSHSIGAS